MLIHAHKYTNYTFEFKLLVLEIKNPRSFPFFYLKEYFLVGGREEQVSFIEKVPECI